MRAGQLVFGAGDHFQTGNGGNGCQGFTAEAQRFDAFEILGRCDLAGCVAQKGRLHVLAGNAASVIGHAQAANAAARHLNGDLRGTCIDAVFDQFLGGGSGLKAYPRRRYPSLRL